MLVHEEALFGLETTRQWLPLAIGTVVLSAWATLALVMARTVLGIPATATAPEPVPVLAPPTGGLRPAPLARALLGVGALALRALPVAWLTVGRGGGEEISLSTEPTQFVDREAPEQVSQVPENAEPMAEKGLPATLIRAVSAITSDAAERIAPGSADLPADVAVIDGRLFMLDSNKSRILTVTPDGKLAPPSKVIRK